MRHAFDYPCPNCGTTSNLHEADCYYSNIQRQEIEQAYTDIAIPLLTGEIAPIPRDEIEESVDTWTELHTDCFDQLERSFLIGKQNGGYQFLSEEERYDKAAEPRHEPLKTIYEQGSVPGCHDNAVFAMIAYYEMIDLPWEEAKKRVISWLKESGAWERGGFSEASPEELVTDKRHVYERSYGWKQKAKAAKKHIDETLG